ncbi:FAD-dependent oxidoreductase [Bacillus sp. V3B]|uniref:FAD-dependent oxidoreductase n=1 Tax=Bacillus sp. V3B TaxID=2804915 RepID=UPI002109BD4E|nr:FAD-dependent oxidoreductase [Bacillus sp. V3B]MCQ6277489.1 FAD-dependent oxidoreductase [Bacillus sp. V3B]
MNEKPDVTLISSSPLLSHFGKQISKKMESVAIRKGLQVVTNEKVIDIHNNVLLTNKKREIRHSQVLWLTGPIADPLFRTSNLPVCDDGFLLVKETLQNVKFPFIFGAGDCVTIRKYNLLPKNGVYAVKQGPILWGNINRYLVDDSGLPFKPQKNFLAILSTGNKEALLTYGKWCLHGNFAWRFKNRIDQKFMRKFLI